MFERREVPRRYGDRDRAARCTERRSLTIWANFTIYHVANALGLRPTSSHRRLGMAFFSRPADFDRCAGREAFGVVDAHEASVEQLILNDVDVAVAGVLR
jgi:hypothetical protein